MAYEYCIHTKEVKKGNCVSFLLLCPAGQVFWHPDPVSFAQPRPNLKNINFMAPMLDRTDYILTAPDQSILSLTRNYLVSDHNKLVNTFEWHEMKLYHPTTYLSVSYSLCLQGPTCCTYSVWEYNFRFCFHLIPHYPRNSQKKIHDTPVKNNLTRPEEILQNMSWPWTGWFAETLGYGLPCRSL